MSRFRKVGVNLGSRESGYLDRIASATDDIDVQCCFLNAGYMMTGFFESHDLDKHMANLECNTTSAVQITHLFLQRLLARKLKGCFVYTSSAAAAIPSPYSVLYASTKSFVSSFGASLAAEVRSEGIDVCVVHPSPVATRFYDKAHKLGALEFFKKMAVGPDELPDVIFCEHRKGHLARHRAYRGRIPPLDEGAGLQPVCHDHRVDWHGLRKISGSTGRNRKQD